MGNGGEGMEKRILGVAVPLYISNYCDSNCSMCNMRKNNSNLMRIDGNETEIKEQLKILYYTECLTWVMFLSGEYKMGEYRKHHLKKVVKVTNTTLEMGFERVTLNIGALDENDISYLYSGIISPEKIGLAVFQETYNYDNYKKEFGSYSMNIPKSDYEKRYQTPEKWLTQGFSQVNLGILAGAGDLKEDVNAMILHARYLKERYSCTIQVSLPRIVQNHGACSDSIYLDYIRYVRRMLPWAEIILTTREKKEFIEQALPYIDVLSPGTSEVLGYTQRGKIGNNPRKSQFFIEEKRERPSEVLQYFKTRFPIEYKYVRR